MINTDTRNSLVSISQAKDVASGHLSRIGKATSTVFKKHLKGAALATLSLVSAGTISTLISSDLLKFPLFTIASIPLLMEWFSFKKDAEEVLRDHTPGLEGVHNQNIALFLEATFDNNTFSIPTPKQENIKNVLEKVSTLEDCGNKIYQARKQNNHISQLWVRAHGKPEQMELNGDSNGRLNYLNVEKLKPIFDLLNADTEIVYFSCGTAGKTKSGLDNIAQMSAEQASGRKLHAATKDILSEATIFRELLGVKIISSNPLKIEFYQEKEDGSGHEYVPAQTY